MDDTTEQPHLEKSNMVDALNNLANAVTSDTSNLTNLTFTKRQYGRTTQVRTIPKQYGIRGVTATQSEKKNAKKWKHTENTRGYKNHTIIGGGVMIRSGIYGLTGIKFMWSTTFVRSLLVTTTQSI